MSNQDPKPEVKPDEPKLSPAKQLQKLEKAASFEAMLKAAEEPLKALVAAYGTVLASIAALVTIAAEQGALALKAQEFAKANKLTTTAKALGRNPLIAHAIRGLAGLRSPVSLPQAWLQLFPEPLLRNQALQKILNDGDLCVVPGMSPDDVTEALLFGATSSELVSGGGRNDDEAAKANRGARGWYGFRGSANPQAPKTDTNLQP
jgi:hypothetical protein